MRSRRPGVTPQAARGDPASQCGLRARVTRPATFTTPDFATSTPCIAPHKKQDSIDESVTDPFASSMVLESGNEVAYTARTARPSQIACRNQP